MAPTVIDRLMHSAAAGPTGTAMKKPIRAPSMTSVMGLKTKPGTVIGGLQLFGREAARRCDQLVLRRYQLQFPLARRARGFQHGEDRRRRAAQRLGDIAAFDPMGREQGADKVARPVGRGGGA